MATKRMCDTGLYDKEWFQQLDPKFKLFWEFITKKCDHAGVWDVNLRMLPIQIGFEYEKDEILSHPEFKTRIRAIDNDKWLVVKHVKFQCGNMLNPNSPFHKAVQKNLKKYNLTFDDGTIVVEGTTEIKVEAEIKEKPKLKSRRFIKPTLQELKDYFVEQKFLDAETEYESMFLHYESNGWKIGKTGMKDWKSAAKKWNKNKLEGKFSAPKTQKREKYVEPSQSDAAW
tara:strand:+ start:219 stop:902 length:684 start_codon:yes stop_codon:yes gene_type:complete